MLKIFKNKEVYFLNLDTAIARLEECSDWKFQSDTEIKAGLKKCYFRSNDKTCLKLAYILATCSFYSKIIIALILLYLY